VARTGAHQPFVKKRPKKKQAAPTAPVKKPAPKPVKSWAVWDGPLSLFA